MAKKIVSAAFKVKAKAWTFEANLTSRCLNAKAVSQKRKPIDV